MRTVNRLDVRRGYSRFIKIIHFTGDLFLLNISFLLAFFLTVNNVDYLLNDHYFTLHIVLNLVWVITAYILKIYSIERVTRVESVMLKIFNSLFLHGLIISAYILKIKGYYYSRDHLLYTYTIFCISLFSWRMLFFKLVKYYRKLGFNYRKVVIVGAGAAGNQMYNYFISDLEHGYRFIGFFDDNPENCLHKDKVLGSVDDVKEYVLNNKVNEIFCALPLTSTKKIRELISIADNNMIRFKMVPDFRGFMNKKVNISFYNRVPVLTLRSEPLENITNRILKRSFDIVFSLAVLLLIFPVLLPLFAILIKLSSRGPVFFVQKRSGRNNEEFNCYKFRTMAINPDADKLQAKQNDPRVTQIGKFLRRTNLDELPQFLNVIVGNMSVVGPRPHMIKHTEEYSMIIDRFMVRHLVKPGITGWAQVNGYRGLTEDPRKMIKRVKYDAWYIENWSLWLDVKIILMTVYNMIKGDKNAF